MIARHFILLAIIAPVMWASSVVPSASASEYDYGQYGDQPPPKPSVRDEGPETPFWQGRSRVGLGGGLGFSSTGFNFTIVGSFGYFVLDNLEVGVDASIGMINNLWSGQLGPQVRYIVPTSSGISPYIGAFFSHWFLVMGDVNSLGGRAGFYMDGGSIRLNVGMVYEHVLGECGGECGTFYPEMGVSFFL